MPRQRLCPRPLRKRLQSPADRMYRRRERYLSDCPETPGIAGPRPARARSSTGPHAGRRPPRRCRTSDHPKLSETHRRTWCSWPCRPHGRRGTIDISEGGAADDLSAPGRGIAHDYDQFRHLTSLVCRYVGRLIRRPDWFNRVEKQRLPDLFDWQSLQRIIPKAAPAPASPP